MRKCWLPVFSSVPTMFPKDFLLGVGSKAVIDLCDKEIREKSIWYLAGYMSPALTKGDLLTLQKDMIFYWSELKAL